VNTLHFLGKRCVHFISLSRNGVFASLFLYRIFLAVTGIRANKVADCTYIPSVAATGVVGE
jgi:hypothetical protein